MALLLKIGHELSIDNGFPQTLHLYFHFHTLSELVQCTVRRKETSNIQHTVNGIIYYGLQHPRRVSYLLLALGAEPSLQLLKALIGRREEAPDPPEFLRPPFQHLLELARVNFLERTHETHKNHVWTHDYKETLQTKRRADMARPSIHLLTFTQTVNLVLVLFCVYRTVQYSTVQYTRYSTALYVNSMLGIPGKLR